MWGEQVYWAISRSMDAVIGSEYYSKRGFAPNGDFRYKGPGLDHLTAKWNALFDRGVAASSIEGLTGTEIVNQGGVDVNALGRKDLSPETRIAGDVDIYPATSTAWFSTTTTRRRSVPRCRATSRSPTPTTDRPFRFDGPLPDLCQFRRRRRGQGFFTCPVCVFDVVDRPLGQGPTLLGHGIVAGLLEPIRVHLPPSQRGPFRLLSTSFRAF